MRKLLNILFLLPLLFTFKSIYAQGGQEIGISGGISQYSGDLTYKSIDPRILHAGGGILYRYNLSPRFNLRADAFYTELSGADSLAPKNLGASSRNLSFKTRLIDVSVMMEFNILPFICGQRKKNWTPYLHAGLCVFNFDPLAYYDGPANNFQGQWYRLQPIGTEAQGTIYGGPKYSLFQIAVPFGLGVKYSLKDGYKKRKTLAGWVLGMEFTWRKTFTDHLDDVGGYYPTSPDVFNGNALAIALSDRGVEKGQQSRFFYNSPRGNPNGMDWYEWLTITITKTIKPNNCFSFK